VTAPIGLKFESLALEKLQSYGDHLFKEGF
jgi:hypothetical protein